MKMMRVMKFRCAFALMALVVVGVSCSDDDDKKRSKTDILTSKSWSISKAEIKSETGTFDISSFYVPDCEKDNRITFSRDGKMTMDMGSNDCDGDETNVIGTWSWKENETVLVITVDSDVVEQKIVELTESALKANMGTMPYDANGDGTDDSEVELIYTFAAN